MNHEARDKYNIIKIYITENIHFKIRVLSDKWLRTNSQIVIGLDIVGNVYHLVIYMQSNFVTAGRVE